MSKNKTKIIAFKKNFTTFSQLCPDIPLILYDSDKWDPFEP